MIRRIAISCVAVVCRLAAEQSDASSLTGTLQFGIKNNVLLSIDAVRELCGRRQCGHSHRSMTTSACSRFYGPKTHVCSTARCLLKLGNTCLQDLLGPLAEPNPQQISEFLVPPLHPPPVELADNCAAVMQWRLRRVWATLKSTPLERVEMLLYVTAEPAASLGASLGSMVQRIENTLQVLEQAAAAVQLCEGIIADLLQVRSCSGAASV
jgi:hypothetical protein